MRRAALTVLLAPVLVIPIGLAAPLAPTAAAPPQVPAVVASAGSRPLIDVKTSGPLPAPRWISGLASQRPQSIEGQLEVKTAEPSESQNVTFYWGLKRPEAAVTKAALATATPGNRRYRHFVSAKKIRNQYGASKRTVTAIEAALVGTGLTAKLDGTGVFARVTGSVASFENYLNTGIEQAAVPGAGMTIAGPVGDPILPSNVAPYVRETIWLSVSQDPGARTALTAPKSLRTVATPQNQGTPIKTCKKFRNVKSGQTYQQAAVAYGTAKLQRASSPRGDIRRFNPRVGIVSMGDGFSVAAKKVAAKCFQWSNGSVDVSLSDGMSSSLPEGMEGDLDVQMVGAMLANSQKIDYYEALPLIYTSQVLPIAKAFNARNRPDVLSISYGMCESALENMGAQGSVSIANSIYARLGLAGTSVVVAAGDSGSAGCTRIDPSLTQPAVSFPSSSPWVTAVGGTRIVLNKNNTRRNEVVWNDSNFVGDGLNLTNNQVGGGGGKSTIFRRPIWQKSTVTHVPSHRAVPDLAAHASFGPAWILNTSVGYQPVAGTSAATPLVAASIALINAGEKLAGRPALGFLNPWLYSIRSPRNNAYFDVVSGTNDLTGNGCCTAKPGYDLTTGLGAPNFTKIRNRLTR